MGTWLFSCAGTYGVCNQHDERTSAPSHPCWNHLLTHTYHFAQTMVVTNVSGTLVFGPSEGGWSTIVCELSNDGVNWTTVGSLYQYGSTTGRPFNFTVPSITAQHMRFRDTGGGYVDGSSGTVTYSSTTPHTIPPIAIINYVTPTQVCQDETLYGYCHDGSGYSGCPLLAYEWSIDGTVIGTTQSFSKSMSTISPGFKTVQLKLTRAEFVSYAYVKIWVCKVPPGAIVDDWPGSGSYDLGTNLHFAGHADTLIPSHYYWYSDIDGLISNDAVFDINNLSLGTHTFSFYVEDQKNNWGFNADFGQLTVVSIATVPKVEPGEYGRAFDTIPSYVRVGTRMNRRTVKGK